MIQEPPNYKIQYMECGESAHAGQKANLVCMNAACSDKPLICSLCTNSLHSGHEFRPLKFYLDQLYKENKTKENRTENQFEQLQNKKNLLLLKLRQFVQTISSEVMSLEDQIIHHYQIMRSNIMESQARKNNFEQFYLNMIRTNAEQTNIQLKNYLRCSQLKTFVEDNRFQILATNFTNQIKKIKKSILVEQNKKKYSSNVALIKDVNTNFILPPCIKHQEDSFIQTNFYSGAPSLCLINFPIANFQNSMNITINKLGAGGKFTLGLIEKEVFEKSNFIKGDLALASFIVSDGSFLNVNYSHIGVIKPASTIQISVKKKQALKIVSKGNACLISLKQKKQFHLFFALEGQTKISIAYPYVK